MCTAPPRIGLYKSVIGPASVYLADITAANCLATLIASQTRPMFPGGQFSIGDSRYTCNIYSIYRSGGTVECKCQCVKLIARCRSIYRPHV